MKIDVHTHTRKCKLGDAPTRDITAEDFCSTVSSTDVGIICITNHNVFDIDQFQKIVIGIGEHTQVWPGIELDVMTADGRGHLLVIVSPKFALRFHAAVVEVTKDSTPDSFTTTIEKVLDTFDSFHPLYVAHYKQKSPSISDKALEILAAGTKYPECIIKEVTNSISAGIYISHGHSSIYGSDLHDWTQYEEYSRELPDLRLPVDSFEHFCLLLKKDSTTINTALNRKISENLQLRPFDDGTALTIKVYNDINIIFGQKGTGKSCILNAIAKHYATKGIDAKVFISGSDRLDEIFDIKCKHLTIDLNDHDINYCTTDIAALRAATEVPITSISKYVNHFMATSTNKNAKKIRLKDITPEKISPVKREFDEFYRAERTTNKFLEFLGEDPAIARELDAEEFKEITRTLRKLLDRLQSREWANFSAWKETTLLNSAIKLFRTEIERKTGVPAKPTTTGFREYALNRINIEIYATTIIKNATVSVPTSTELVGNLGSSKGTLELVTEFRFQDGAMADGSWSSSTGAKKNTQRLFMQHLRVVLEHVFDGDLFQHLLLLNSIEGIDEIKTVFELLLVKRYFSLDGAQYSPSSGESSMVMLQKELGIDKDIYILDEPERSLGNEYISDVIVPLIKERARAGKKVFISTHDANIAVRTLPYSSVYRSHGKDGYRTYAGNPFTNNLTSSEIAGDQLDWKKISMRTLEGGEEAFGERGSIYGNN
jgi:predicted ATPase